MQESDRLSKMAIASSAVASVLTFLAAPSAVAQPFGGNVSANMAPPAEKLAVTAGQVDIRSGQYQAQFTDLRIGDDSETGGLALTRSARTAVKGHENPFGNFSHNWNILITEKKVDIKKGNYEIASGSDYRVSVRFGGRSQTFEAEYTSSGYQLVSNAGNSTLTYTGTRDSAGVIYTFQAADGTRAIFRPLGNKDCSAEIYYRCAYVSEIIYVDGSRLLFEYENPTPGIANTTRLRSVVSNRGYALLFEYGVSAWLHVGKVCALNLSEVAKPSDNTCPSDSLASSYAYSSIAGDTTLGSITDAGGAVSTIVYSADPVDVGIAMAFSKPGTTTPWLTNYYYRGANDEFARTDVVYKQVFATGEQYLYHYHDPSVQTEGTNTTPTGGEYTDSASGITKFEYGFPRRPRSLNPPRFDPFSVPIETFGDSFFQATPGPERIVDPLGRITTLDYCDPFLKANLPPIDTTDRCLVVPLQSFTDPDGIRTELKYDGYRNVTEIRTKAKPGSGLPDVVTTAFYNCLQPKSCTKPSSTTDAKGHQTLNTYSTDHGGLLTKIGPAPVAGGARPLTVRSYIQKYAYVKNSGGMLIPASTPVWMLASETACQTVSGSSPPAVCDEGAPQTITAYEYGADGTADNLLLRGVAVTADGQTLRTCYGYDDLGRRISETKPAANLSVCP